MDINSVELNIKYHCNDFLEQLELLKGEKINYQKKHTELANLYETICDKEDILINNKSWLAIIGLCKDNYFRHFSFISQNKDLLLYDEVFLCLNEEKLNKEYEKFQKSLSFPFYRFSLTDKLTQSYKHYLTKVSQKNFTLTEIVTQLSSTTFQFITKKDFNEDYECQK